MGDFFNFGVEDGVVGVQKRRKRFFTRSTANSTSQNQMEAL